MTSIKEVDMKRVLLSVALVVSGASAFYGYAFSPIGGMIGRYVFSVNPVMCGDIYAGGTAQFTAEWEDVLAFGISDFSDFYISDGGWGMIRYDLSKGNDLAIVALYADTESAGLQYHLTASPSEAFTFEWNLNLYLPYADWKAVLLESYVAPVLTLGDNFAIYCEVNPSWDTSTGDIGLTVMPGVWFALGDGEASIGVSLGGLLDNAIDVGYGMWYYLDFDLGGGE